MRTCQAESYPTAVVSRNWPLSSAMPPMAALPTVPAVARAFVRTTLSTWHMQTLIEGAELVASELASNAVAASTGRDGRLVYVNGRMSVIRICLLTDGVRALLLEVWDQAPGIPAIRNTDDNEESGRGLALVDAIADRWGWRAATGRPGKVVCTGVRLSTPEGCELGFHGFAGAGVPAGRW
jgi:anti-sigma regulatory factor (Ser/Thr protein kinase)